MKVNEKCKLTCHERDCTASAVTRIRTWVVSATTRSTNHYTITAIASTVAKSVKQASWPPIWSVKHFRCIKYILLSNNFCILWGRVNMIRVTVFFLSFSFLYAYIHFVNLYKSLPHGSVGLPGHMPSDRQSQVATDI